MEAQNGVVGGKIDRVVFPSTSDRGTGNTPSMLTITNSGPAGRGILAPKQSVQVNNPIVTVEEDSGDGSGSDDEEDSGLENEDDSSESDDVPEEVQEPASVIEPQLLLSKTGRTNKRATPTLTRTPTITAGAASLPKSIVSTDGGASSSCITIKDSSKCTRMLWELHHKAVVVKHKYTACLKWMQDVTNCRAFKVEGVKDLKTNTLNAKTHTISLEQPLIVEDDPVPENATEKRSIGKRDRSNQKKTNPENLNSMKKRAKKGK